MWEEPLSAILYRWEQNLFHTLPYVVLVEVSVASCGRSRGIRTAAVYLTTAIYTLPHGRGCLGDILRANNTNCRGEQKGRCQCSCQNFLHHTQLLMRLQLYYWYLPTSENALFFRIYPLPIVPSEGCPAHPQCQGA